MASTRQLAGILQGILQEGGDSPREIALSVSEILTIPEWEAAEILGDFLGHEVPEDNSGTLHLDGPRVILDIPERGIYHTISI